MTAVARAPLVTPSGRFDRAAIFRDAHRQYRLMARHGWNWSRCLSFSWAKAKGQRADFPSFAIAHCLHNSVQRLQQPVTS